MFQNHQSPQHNRVVIISSIKPALYLRSAQVAFTYQASTVYEYQSVKSKRIYQLQSNTKLKEAILYLSSIKQRVGYQYKEKTSEETANKKSESSKTA